MPIRRDTVYEFLFSSSASYRATAAADFLDGMERGEERVSFPELGNDLCHDRQPVVAIGCRIDCSDKGRAAIVFGRWPETEVSHQSAAVIKTRLYPISHCSCSRPPIDCESRI